jgi:predicted permease
MKLLRVVRYRLRALYRGAQLDRETEEEMRFHVDMVAREYEAAGHTPQEARRRALLDFGGLTRKQEEARGARGVRWLEDLGRDLRYGLRMLRKSPVFTAVAIVSLGLGIGANTAIFSLVDAVLLRSLPVPNPQQLRVINWTGTDGRFWISGRYSQLPGQRLGVGDAVSYRVFHAVRERCADHAEVFGFTRLSHEVTAHLPGGSFVAEGLMVSDNFFEGLGVGASFGRVFTSTDPDIEASTWMVISHDWWQRRFGADPEVVGKTVTLNEHPFVVIGVLPQNIRGLHSGDAVDFYVSMAAQPALMPWWSRAAEDKWWVVLLARLVPGTSDAQFAGMAEAAFVNAAGDMISEASLLLYDGRAGLKEQRDSYRRPLMILFGIGGVVILVACANLAGLSLARGAAREHEFALRPALGASRGRLLRQSLTESLLLGLLGAGFGVAVAVWGKAALAGLLLAPSGGLHYAANLDVRVLGFTLCLSLVVGVLAGILPALRAVRVDPASRLKERGVAGSPRLGLGRTLVAGQMALSVVLLVGAGLYGRTLLNLVRIDPGFETNNLLLFQLNPESAGYDGERFTAFYDGVAQSLDAIPGVRGVALSRNALLSGWMSGGDFNFPDRPAEGEAKPRAYWHSVNEAYFETMGIPIVSGRGLELTDTDDAPNVAVVNETFARRYFDAGSPLGQRLNIGGADRVIVGVSRDVKYTGIKEDVPPTVYTSFRQDETQDAFFAVRTEVPPLTLLDQARRAVAAVDARVPLDRVETQLQIRDRSIAEERLFAYLCGALAGLGLLLSCIGLYGLTAYNVTRRVGDIGVRLALGATRRQIAFPILREAVGLVAVGSLVGLALALGAVEVISSQLYGVGPHDPLTLGVGTLVLLGVALVAVWPPVRRATSIDPVDALRVE